MIPVKPFDTYKWRWLSVAPTESLLQAPVFLGVLRVLAKHEGERPSEAAIAADLQIVQDETRTTVDLVRTPERNLIRNSGQYWKGTGLLLPNREIRLTSLGRKVADGKITQGEFAAIMVQQTVLPNPSTYDEAEIAKWRAADLEIRPLALILKVIEGLAKSRSGPYLKPSELIRIVIPLAGQKSSPGEIASYVTQYRQGELDVSGWPNCAPESNDERLAREFLLFLSNFGVLKLEERDRLGSRYVLDEAFNPSALDSASPLSIFADERQSEAAVASIIHSELPSIIERQKTLATVVRRTGQSKFRNDVLRSYQGKCFLTGEEMPEVLEAAHIVPVEYSGQDHSNNGICLRVDIHRLFDSFNIRIRPDGTIILSEAVTASRSYGGLPARVPIPPFVNPANIKWRDAYL